MVQKIFTRILLEPKTECFYWYDLSYILSWPLFIFSPCNTMTFYLHSLICHSKYWHPTYVLLKSAHFAATTHTFHKKKNNIGFQIKIFLYENILPLSLLLSLLSSLYMYVKECVHIKKKLWKNWCPCFCFSLFINLFAHYIVSLFKFINVLSNKI